MLGDCSEDAQSMIRGCSGDVQGLLRFSRFASPRSTGSAQSLARMLYKFLTRLIVVWRMFQQLPKRITHSRTQQPCVPATNPAVSLGAGFGCCSPLAGSTGKFGEFNWNKTSPVHGVRDPDQDHPLSKGQGRCTVPARQGSCFFWLRNLRFSPFLHVL